MTSFDPIAVVSMGCAFPGAPDPDIFWRRIVGGVDATGPVPPDRWAVPASEMVAHGFMPDKALSNRACLVSDLNADLSGLNVAKDVLQTLDPLYHLLIHAARQAAGGCRLTPEIDPARIATILAAIALPTDGSNRLSDATVGRAYRRRLKPADAGAAGASPPVNALGARVTSFPAAVTAACFGWTAGAFTLDAACASSLYAVKLACDELHARRADAVVTGGVSRPDCLYTQVGFSQLRALSPSGRCAPFSRNADGLVVGEGAGVVVLKRLEDALAHGDTVYGVIRGIGLSNDMRGNLLAPDSDGQLRAMRQAYDRAGWHPEDVDHIECHGAGTPVGDATELGSLATLWEDRPAVAGQCAIGSVKSMIGHLLTAAGAAGLIKSLLALHHRTLPPSLKADPPADHPALSGGPFTVLPAAAPWPPPPAGRGRRAAVSAFGFGGINAHLLLEAWTPGTVTVDAGDVSTVKAADVAIVGLAARCGACGDTAAFDAALQNGARADAATDGHRWYGVADDVAAGCGAPLSPGGYMKTLTIAGGRFRIPPAEFPDILTQHLLMLDVAADAIEDAGLPLKAQRPRMGGVIGIDFDIEATDFHLRWRAASEKWGGGAVSPEDIHPPLTATRTLGALGGIIASRIAREFGFGGPSYVVSADAASGCRAVEIGVQSLRQGETDLFLAGAVDLAGDIRRIAMDAPFLEYGCGSHGARPADGAAALILKRLDDAVADGDTVYGVISGIGKAGAPTLSAAGAADAYSRSLQMALAGAGRQPAEVSLWECHGSGAPSEDTTEAAALAALAVSARSRLPVHSVAGQLGHCGAAAGLLSIAAAALGLGHGRQPAAGGGGLPLPAPFVWSDGKVPEGDGNTAVAAALAKDGTVMHVVVSAPPRRLRPPQMDRRGSPTGVAPGKGYVRRLGKAPLPLPSAPPVTAPAPPVETTIPAPTASASARPTAPAATDSGPMDATYRMAADTVVAGSTAVAAAHQRFLDFSRAVTDAFADAVSLQGRLMAAAEAAGTGGGAAVPDAAPVSAGTGTAVLPQTPLFSRDQCLAFAIGRAASVLGPEFADLDTYRTRVRLPDEPLMLVDRILTVEGEKDSLDAGRVVTEHDVLPGAWYLDGGRAPVSISVEAGQADLFLCAWLGIDHRVKGARSYRLLDAAVTFHRDLPQPGDTIRYDIHIDKFIRQQETYLFFFRFEGHIGEDRLITMTGGCAGFFTPEEVRRSGGIILTEEEKAPASGISRVDWMPPVPSEAGACDAAAVDALRAGRLADAFGPAFAGIPLAEGLRLPGGRMRLIHRIRRLDPAGGQYGLGRVEAEADVSPDDWFLTCHFVDDMTMPGTLMYDCCAHALRVLLQRLGWVSDDPAAHYAPVVARQAKLVCRGPVTPESRQVRYAVDIKEIGYGPEPYVIADAHMYADGRYIVMFRDMSMRMVGVGKNDVQAVWQRAAAAAAPPVERAPLYDYERILAFSVGRPSDAFGTPYRAFDTDRRIARLPGPPYLFMSRVTAVEPPPWELAPGGWITAEYDMTGAEWYFGADRSGRMPFCVLLEIALQPCGWLAAYCGSALRSGTDLKFRNLGGDAVLHRTLPAGPRRLTMRARLTKVSEAGEMIIEHFDFEVLDDAGPVYTGTTYFGFFTATALGNQIGFRRMTALMDGAEKNTPSSPGQRPLPRRHPTSPEDVRIDRPDGLCLPGRALLMIDAVDTSAPDGGGKGLGYLRARKSVDPSEWFFAAHFYQDPVCPGSLGVESFLQTLRLQARERWPQLRHTHRFDMIPGHRHQWAYRGQVIPENNEIIVESEVTAIDSTDTPTLYGQGFLWCDGRCIYEMKDFGIRLSKIKTAR